jgi:hypothetical protein
VYSSKGIANTVAEELVLTSVSNDDHGATAAFLVSRRFRGAPLFAPMSLDCVKGRLKPRLDKTLGKTTVSAVVEFNDPNGSLGWPNTLSVGWCETTSENVRFVRVTTGSTEGNRNGYWCDIQLVDQSRALLAAF